MQRHGVQFPEGPPCSPTRSGLYGDSYSGCSKLRYMRRCRNCNVDLPNWISRDGVRRNISNRVFCLRCVPWGTRRQPRAMCRQCSGPVTARNAVFCSSKCQQEWQHRMTLGLWLAGKISGHTKRFTVSNTVRRWLIEQRGEQCWECGWATRHTITGLVPLTVDHIDGNCSNTCPENLRLLCPNCHSLTPTYGALNRGNSHRAWRRPASRPCSSVGRAPV